MLHVDPRPSPTLKQERAGLVARGALHMYARIAPLIGSIPAVHGGRALRLQLLAVSLNVTH